MSRRFQFSLRALAFAVTLTAVLVWLAILAYREAGKQIRRSPSLHIEPPRIGETAAAVVNRFGQPDFDSRVEAGDSDQDYHLGYTLSHGTHHHLHVTNGRIVDISYSSR